MTNIYVETDTPEYYDVTIKGVEHFGIEKSAIRHMIEKLDASDGVNVWIRGVNYGNMAKKDIDEIVMELDNLIHH